MPQSRDDMIALLKAMDEKERRKYGPKLSPEDREIYNACRWDLKRFALEFFPHICTDDFNAVHTDYYALYRDRHGTRGHKDVVAAPRGSSKTTGCAMVGIMHDCCYQNEAFIVYLTNRAEHADIKVRDMRDELEHNAKLVRIFGSQVGTPWNQGDFTTSHGVRVLAAGRQTQVRGITANMQRPTKIVIDDAEYAEQVIKEEQRQKTWDWLMNDIMKLGQPSTNVEVSGTIIHPQSMLATLLKTPGWHGRHYKSVIQFAHADAIPHWQTWRQLYVDLGNPNNMHDAYQYFLAHQDEMLAGTDVLWPTRRSYYDLMCTRLSEGESSFWQELQNAPQQDARFIFDMDDASYCRVLPEGIQRADGTYIPYLDIPQVVAYWDPVPDKRQMIGTDFAACPIIMQDKQGYAYIVDCYVNQEVSTATQIKEIVELLWLWQVPMIGVESNGFQSLLAGSLREALRIKADAERSPWTCGILPIVNTRSKVLRIQSLESVVANGWLQFSHNLPAQVYQQFADFIPVDGAGKDDVPDAVEGAIRVVRGLYDSRAAF